MISASIGAGFGVLFSGVATTVKRGVFSGLSYGVIWWLLGPLTLMPAFMGMGLGANLNIAAAGKMLPSLMGHMIFGIVLGFVYARAAKCFKRTDNYNKISAEDVVQGGAV